MQRITIKEVEKLIDDPIGFAMTMDCVELEQVIVAFVSVLNKRKQRRGDQNCP